jgi:hypothetical protein
VKILLSIIDSLLEVVAERAEIWGKGPLLYVPKEAMLGLGFSKEKWSFSL